MAPLSLKIILDEASVTKTLLFDTRTTVSHVHDIVKDKIVSLNPDKEYGFFLTSADDECSGVWLEDHRTLEYYMLRDGDSLYYLERMRNLRLRMLDGSVKTLQVDESKAIGDLMLSICDKIGTTNYEEYGLCREHMEIEEETKPMTGTLTLKRKAQAREKDAKLEQLSKKLKTDDNVEWLDQHKTLRELRVDPKETLLFKRRLFYSDRKVDARDPVQLNLLYVQTRDAILDGRQIVTEAKAIEFAGLQCQVHFEDFNEEKHKPGFIENLREFLPAQYATSWGIEKKIFKEHRKHQGLSPLEAKNLYTKTARELPTYGVTFFLVKEKHKGKKKLIPRLLGINASSILRLDEDTKEILQVWPLTQVKSYRAASESFTLDFGDYSEKEYAVKTNEAFRIKDILQGYIDIIRKKLAAPYNVVHTEGDVICEENVEISRGTIIQNIVPSKIVEQSFVGPSSIISVQQGHRSSEGTTITTVHEVVTVNRGDRSQQGMIGETLGEPPHMFGRRLNRINSLSVKTVVLLSDGNEGDYGSMYDIVSDMENELPAVVKGVRDTAKKVNDEQSKKLLDELDELCEYINNLSNIAKSSDYDKDKLESANEIAKKLADISAQMYLSLDPKSKRRSQFINSSRNSFIADEQTEANLRRMSLRTVVESTHDVLDSCYSVLDQQYAGTSGDPLIYSALEKSVNHKLGKLNAAIASLIIAHSDPKEVNYSTAVTCMSTIKELVPELLQDVKALNSMTEDDEARLALTDEIKRLIDRTAALCRLNGTDDPQKLQEAGNAYGEVSRSLIYKFNRGKKMNLVADKENEIMDLAQQVGESASKLLIEVSELNSIINEDPRSEELDTAGVKCADAARELYECAKLIAPSIHEPHCQSALTGACENLTSSVQHLSQIYKPIVDDPGRHYYGKRLANEVTDLNKALERLMNAYANLNENENDNSDGGSDEKTQKLKFILSRARKALVDMEDQLLSDFDEPRHSENPQKADIKLIESKLSQNIAKLNAAIATLLQATSSESPDYEKIHDAINTISQITPKIIQDSKALDERLHELGGGDETSKQKLLDNLNDILHAAREVCASAEDDNKTDLNAAASKLAKATKKLQWMYNPLTNVNKEHVVMEQAKEVGNKTSALLMDTSELLTSIGNDPRAEDLEAAGVRCADAAKDLITCAELTTPTIENIASQSALKASCGILESALQTLNDTYKPIVSEPERYYYGNTLAARNEDLVKALDKLKDLCARNDMVDTETLPESEKEQRLKFVMSLSRFNDALKDADYKLNNPSISNDDVKSEANRDNLQKELSKKIAKLNAAIAQLCNSISGLPNYEKTNAAIETIAELTPEIIRDGRTLEAHIDGNEQKELRQNLQHILDATHDICTHAAGHDNEGLTDAVEKFGKSSGKLNFIFKRHSKPKEENQTVDLAKDVGDKTSVLLYQTRGLIGADDELKPEYLKLNDAIMACKYAAKELESCAQLTAPFLYEPSCQEALTEASKNLANKIQSLALAYKPLLEDPNQINNREIIISKTMGVMEALDKLKDHAASQQDCDVTRESTIEDEPKRMFKASLTESKKALSEAIQQLERDSEYGVKQFEMVGSESNTSPRAFLSQNVAQLNGAIVSLLHATTDTPDYDAATSALLSISNIIPKIVKAGECIDGENPKASMIEKIKPMITTVQEICKSAEEDRYKDLNNSTMQYADQSEAIYRECSPKSNERKKDRILDLSKGACKDASVYLTKVYQLAQKVGVEEATELDVCGAKIVDTAQVFLTAAQVTAPTMEEPQCQNALISFTDTFSKKIHDLDNKWAPLTGAHNKDLADQMKNDSNKLQKTLNELRNVCTSDSGDEDKEQLQTKVLEVKDKLNAIEKLASKERLRELPEPPLLEFVSIMTKDQGCIEKTTIEPTKLLLCERLSQLNQSIALLVRAMTGRGEIDYKVQEELVQNISQTAPETIKYILSTHKYLEDNAKEEMIAEAKALCEATQGVLGNFENDNTEELSDALSKYAYSSGKLYFIFSPYKKAESKKEAEIVHTARSACERTSLMLSRVSRLAQTLDASEAEPLDRTGVQLADAAQSLLTNAQLTSPSIRFECSQSVLEDSVNQVNELSEKLGNAWSPLVSSDEQLGQQLDKDLEHLQTDLYRLKDIIRESNQWIPQADIEIDDNTNKKIDSDSKPDKDLLIEDTPLKELASKILDSAKSELEDGNLSVEKHSALKCFTNELTAALCALDLATARCKRDPVDAKKRQDLENVIQNVQHLCLVGQREADAQTNIIDLMLFVKDVMTAANELYQSTEFVHPNCPKKALVNIRDACDDIIGKAENLSNTPDIPEDSILHDMLITEQFAQECDANVKAIQDSVEMITDNNSRNLLHEKLRALIEKCDLLKFAAKGSVSSAAGLAIEEDLQNLTDAEKKIELLLTANEMSEATDNDTPVNIEAIKTAQKPLTSAVIAKQDDVPHALTQYAMRMLAATPKDPASQLKLNEHLKKLLSLLKKRNLASGRRVATWQDADGDDVTDITKQIVEEIHEYIPKDKKATDGNYLQTLMTFKDGEIDGDINELNSKLSQQTQKLSFMIGTVILNSDKPEGITRAVRSTAEVVAEISALSKAIRNKDVIQGKKMEKATHYLTAAMYNLLETSESVSQEFEKPESRRKLLDACRTLTEALNKLAQVSSRADKTKRDGEEFQRNIQLQQVLLSPNLPTCALSLEDTLDALQSQGEIIHKLDSEETMSQSECGTTLRYVAAAACASAQYASHSTYLLAISEENQDAAKKGLIDHNKLNQISDNVDEVCSKIISGDKEQAKSLEPVLSKHIQILSEFVDDCTMKMNEDESAKVKKDYIVINSAMDQLKHEIQASSYKDDKVISRSLKLLDAINRLKLTMKRSPTPRYNGSTAEKHNLGIVMENAKNLLNDTSRLVSQVTSSEEEVLTWVMYGAISKQVIKSYEALLTCIRNKGSEMKVLQATEISNDNQEPQKSHLQTQIDLINKWLRNPACKQDVKNEAIRAAENIIDMGDKICEDLKDPEKEEMLHVVVESKELLKECSVKYQSAKASLLLERLRELKGMLERGVVTRVVEEFLEEQPLEDIENIRKETDVKRRDLLLDKKIAELLAQLGRVSRTAQFVSDTTTAPIRHDIINTSKQVELLAPSLVKAAQDSVKSQDDQAIENYRDMVMKYAESLSRVRELCDRAVNPVDFAQAAVETMARIKEASKNDPIKAAFASSIITRLGNRVVEAGMSSANVQKDLELQETLASIKKSIKEAHHTKTDLAAEIIRKTGEVESALGGETIFQKEPEADQPIFAAAHGLHAAVRDWSARDNEVVAVAKRVAVLMARLAHHMYNDRKSELIATSKEIVAKSHEVAALARKLAMECSDLRIRNNLLQVCQRIPLISGQLKMLTTVKGSTLGKQGSEEDKEAMNMLVGNAQNLMTSIQEIVKVAESASVKIMSQRGRRIRWVRRYY
ncbi:talin-B [Pieris rapae]|uniref:talin-B n=1 Tax=Pieris rapae TaxID=64459 RepID=UPI001E27B45E|nr:talin-B [Pieris rapae]XP_045486621.1 talin-B [Pieris rapae]XP_045486622.1 talin-B [Pieris rapae]